MSRLFGGFLAGLASLSLLVAPASANNTFHFYPPKTYESVSQTVMIHEFFAPIRTNIPAGDDLFFDIDPQLPPGWFTQYCQVSTGICYFDDAVITLANNNPDQIRFDFIMPPGDINKGWVNVKISRASDPTTWVEETFAVGHGVTLPQSRYIFRVPEAFQQANPMDVVEFFASLISQNNFDDRIYTKISMTMPQGWFAQYCHVTTGICYLGDAEIDFPAQVNDQFRIDFFCFNPNPAIGHYRIKTQSAANPAIWKAIPFRVRTGQIPADVETGTPEAGFAVHAAPNPVRATTDLKILLDRPAMVRMEILDVTGRPVRTFDPAMLGAGVNPIRWDGTDAQGRPLPNGVYFYRVDGGARSAKGKLTLDR